MPDIADMIREHIDDPDSRFVITGALKPLCDIANSDAGLNLGISVATLQNETAGRISLVMNGEIFDATGAIIKDISSGRFFEAKNAGLYPDRGTRFDFVYGGGRMHTTLNRELKLVPSSKSPVPDYLVNDVKMREFYMSLLGSEQDKMMGRHNVITSNSLPEIWESLRNQTRAKKVIVCTDHKKIRSVRDFLAKKLQRADGNKVVVITASHYPLKDIFMSDAPFQLGYAIGKAGELKPGVYVAIDGSVE